MSESSAGPDVPHDARIGERVGRYLLIARIGEGGAGVVYRAEDTTTGDAVALKILRGAHVGDAEHRRRFLREARVVAALEHEGVVRVREVGEAGDYVFLCMDLAPGTSLRAYIDAARGRGEAIPLADVVAIARAIAEPVAHAHARGVVHRDLKPDNVMVTSALSVRVLDFGLAKLRETTGGIVYDAETEMNVTVDGRVLGTPAYMSPEQATGKEVGFRTDVFSLGVLLYEMLADVRPFAGTSTMDVIVSITRDTPRPPSAHAVRVGPELDRLVMKCLEKRPADRLDMKDLVRELARPELGKALARRALRLGRLGKATAVGAMVIACGAAALALRTSPPAHAGATVLSGSPPVPSSAPTTLLDLPLPSSSVPEALSAYRGALQDERDGAEDSAFIKLEQATKLDPSLAAAHLRLAIRLAFFEADAARAHFVNAAKLADQLSPRDREVVEANRPLFQRDPPDFDEWARRVTALAERYPNDADLWLQVATMHNAVGEFPADISASKHALAIDPRYGLALNELGQAQAYVGDFEGARATVATCLGNLPNASWCMWTREGVNGEEGKCADNEATARERIAVDPTIPDGYKALYYALTALDRPVSLAREAIDQTVKRADPKERARLRATLGARLDALHGNFVAAAREASDLRATIEQDSDLGAHSNAATLSAEIELEAGRNDNAVRVATDFVNRREVWAHDPIAHDYPLAHDTTPLLLSIAFHIGHTMTKSAYDAAIAKWRARWDAGLRGGYRPYLWVYGYAPLVESRDEAIEAVAALASYSPIPPFMPNGRGPTIPIGRTLLLAGRKDEGLAYLKRGTSGCDAGISPMLFLHGHAWLGDALAERGDKAGACAEYGVVLAHWGEAKPRSVTADYARTQRRALGCDAH